MKNQKTMRFLLALLLGLTGWTATAQSLPAPDDFLPHRLGAAFTPHHLLVDYFEEVAAQSPRVKLIEYGRTHEDRPLLLAFISTPANLARLEAIRTNNLRNAGLLPGEPDPTLDDFAIVWLSYSVHGNEAAGSETSMGVLHDLASPDHPRTGEWLKNTLVILDPCLNPDGYNRYTNWYRQTANLRPDTDPAVREHQEPWPGGRVNHYLFDLNRDWAWQTQRESQQRMQQYRQWMPHIHADLHEQDYTSPYYFAPAAAPFHNYITDWQADFQTEIGKNHARYFDQEGWLYFTREYFDLLYPSYGDTWPTFNGAIGMTYEQAGHGRAGRAIDLPTGDTLTLFDRIAHHRTTSLSTVEIASKESDRLVENFRTYFRQGATAPQGEYRTYVVGAENARGKLRRLTRLLQHNGIAYGFATRGYTGKMYNYRTNEHETASVNVGDLIISAYQPRSVLTQVLFDPEVTVEDSVTYDITAWSVPFAFGLQAYASEERIAIQTIPGDTTDFQETTDPLAGQDLTRTYAYVIPWEDLSSAAFLGELLSAGINARTAPNDVRFGQETFARGAIIINRGDNRQHPDLSVTLRALARKHRVEVKLLDTGFSTSGGDLGSSRYQLLQAPEVAVLGGKGVDANQFGQVWHYFEQELKYPVSIFYPDDLAAVFAGDFDVLVLPEGRYQLQDQAQALTDWVRDGGKLIAIGSANSSLGQIEALALAPRQQDTVAADQDMTAQADDRLLPYAGRERRFISSFNPGVIIATEMDPAHPLAYGIGDRYFSLKTGTAAFDYLDDGVNVGRFRQEAFVSGFIGHAARRKLAETLVFGVADLGQGKVVHLIDNPLYRGFWEEGKLLFANALFLVK